MNNWNKVIWGVLTLLVLGFIIWLYSKPAEATYVPKVNVCHCEQPDGDDPFQCQTLNIALPAAAAHLAQHDADYAGICQEASPSPSPSSSAEPTTSPSSTPEASGSASPSPTATPFTTSQGGGGDGGGDGLGCAVNDCSGNRERKPENVIPAGPPATGRAK